MKEPIRCATTFKGFSEWFASYMAARGHQAWQIRAEPWPLDPSGWATGVTYRAPSMHSLIRLQVTDVEPEHIEVIGYIDLAEEIAPEDETELQTALEAISRRYESLAQQAGRRGITLPKNKAVLRQWKAVWRVIQDDVHNGARINAIQGRLSRNHAELSRDVQTLARIVEAGSAGLLDD